MNTKTLIQRSSDCMPFIDINLQVTSLIKENYRQIKPEILFIFRNIKYFLLLILPFDNVFKICYI